MNRIIDVLIKHYGFVLIAVFLLSAPFMYYTLNHEFFNHIDIFFDNDDPNLQYYKQFQKTYGNEELAVIVFKQKDIFTSDNMRIIRKISESIKNTPGIQRVFSLTEHEKAWGSGNIITFKKLVPDKDLSSKELAGIRQIALSDDVIRNNLISPDGTTTSILIELMPFKINEKKRDTLLDVMDKAKNIARTKKKGEAINLRFAGVPYVEVEMNYLSKRDFFTFTPLVFLVIFIIVFALLKKASISVLCQLNLLLSLTWTVGFFVACGETFNMATVVIGPVILAIAVADSIHMLAHYRKLYVIKGQDHVEAVHNAAKSVWLPCLLTSLTTGVGFFSFITGSIRPVKILGVFTSAGVFFAFVLTILFLPASLMLFISILKRKNNRSAHDSAKTVKESRVIFNVLEKTGSFTIEHRKFFFSLLIIIFIVSVTGITKIKFETNFMNYLPRGNPIRQDIDFIEENMGGTIPFVMLIQATNAGNAFDTTIGLEAIEKTQKDLMNMIPQFTTSFSIADYFKEINQAFNGGKNTFYRIPQKDTDILDFYEIGNAEVLDRLIAPDRMEARISFQSRWDSNETAKRLNRIVKDYMHKNLGKDFTYRFTGLSSLYLDMEHNMKESQRTSFTLAFIIIFAMMYLVCRNITLTLLSMTVNLFPIAVTLGIMGWLAIPMDISTIMIASVTIGIAVDDTIHYITWYRRNRSHGKDIRPALLQSLHDVGRPIVITSVVLFLGFFILIMGTIKPTRAFGVLTAFAMFFALIGDIIFLPVLITIFKPGK